MRIARERLESGGAVGANSVCSDSRESSRRAGSTDVKYVTRVRWIRWIVAGFSLLKSQAKVGQMIVCKKTCV